MGHSTREIKCLTCEFLCNGFKLLRTEIKVVVGVQGGEEKKPLGTQSSDTLLLMEGQER